MTCIENFLHRLKDSPGGAIFNPWWQLDPENDFGPEAPRIRRQQLHAYLTERIETTRLVLVGEALGYRGGHFSGIPMTSERMLLQHQRVLTSITPRRTSKMSKWPRGFSEPTASMVWNALLDFGFAGYQFVLWNAFPWHPYDRRRGCLSNRKPGAAELRHGSAILKELLRFFPGKKVIALGKVAAVQTQQIGYDTVHVRHPANAGAVLFRQQLRDRLSPQRAIW